ncbi:MAG: TonB-dependent receptor [Bacteroidetes bacterium]|nr:TonB-dependent receptor [Bacteroidota bacterium]
MSLHSVFFFFLGLFIGLFSIPATAQSAIPLKAYLDKVEEKHDIVFSYRPSDLEGQLINPPSNLDDIQAIILFLRSQTPFNYTVINETSIAIVAKNAGQISVCGRLIDAYLNEPIAEATVYEPVSGKGTITDSDGFFRLKGISPTALLSIQHMIYAEQSFAASLFVDENACRSYFLKPQTRQLSEVVVSNVLASGIDITSDGALLIRPKQFGILPGLIEPDVLQILQRLPGVESINETVSNINIRGGTNDQNLILWDGIKMYQTGHFFGLISTINPYLTEQIQVYKNGVSAQYGDGVSGMVNFKTTSKIPVQIKGGAGINLINGDAYLQIPFGTKWGLQVSGRRSFNDFFSTPTYDEYFDRAFQDSKITTRNNLSANENFSSDESFVFYDVNAKLIFEPNEKSHFEVNFFNLDNRLSFRESITVENEENTRTRTSSLDQRNIAVGLSGEILLNEQWRILGNAYYTNYNLEATNFDLRTSQQLDQKNEVLESQAKLILSYTLNEKWNFNGGYEVVETGVTNLQRVNDPFFFSSIKNALVEHAGFVEAGHKNASGLNATVGLRASFVPELGESFFEPRFNILQALSSTFSLSLMGELKHQVTTQTIDLQEDFLGVEKRRWTLADNEDIPVVHSKQLSFGLNYEKDSWFANVTSFYKTVDEVFTDNLGFQDQLEFANLKGEYNVKGVEVLVDKKLKALNLSVSYAYKDNQLEFDSLMPSKIRNHQDVKHSVGITGAYQIKQLKLSLGYQWRTGKPFTEPDPENPISNEGIFEEINYQNANSSTLPNYRRFDFSSEYHFMWSKTRVVLGLSVLNVLDDKNILNTYYTLDNTNGNSEVRRVDNLSLGITPNVSFRVFF